MTSPAARRWVALILGLTALTVAPAPPVEPPPPAPLAEARFKAATKQFGEVWAFYRQSRSDSFQTYFWSRLVLDSQQALSDAKADRVAACEAHLERMRRLETLVKRVRKLGFGFSTDVGASEYYRLEAECWLERAKGG